MQEEADKDRHHTKNEEAGGPAMVGGQGGAQRGELALEDAEGWRANHGEGRQQEQPAGPGQPVDDAVHLAEVRRAVVLLHVAGGKEHQRLGDAMKQHVQHRAQRA